MLDTTYMAGVVVIGEGEKDEAPMLYNGEEIGSGTGPEVDVAVDPLEGTTLDREGPSERDRHDRLRRARDDVLPGRGRLHGQDRLRPRGADAIDIEAPPAENVKRVAKAKGVKPSDVTVVVLERDRHTDLIAELRAVEAKVLLITDGDVAPAIAAAQPGTGVDLLMGVGGTPEGVLSASALKCVGGALQGKLWPRNDEERQAAHRRRLRPRPGADDRRPRRRRRRLLRGDRRHDGRAAARRSLHARRARSRTRSSCARARGPFAAIEAHHAFGKLEALSGRRFQTTDLASALQLALCEDASALATLAVLAAIALRIRRCRA